MRRQLVCLDERWGSVFPEDVPQSHKEEFLAHSNNCPYHGLLIDQSPRDKYPPGTADELVGGVRNADFEMVLPKSRR